MTIPMKQWLFLIVILFPNLLLADRLNTDSLKNELENTRVDTSKVKLLILLWESTAYSEPETAKTYAEKALELSQNNHYKKGIAEAYQRLAAGFTVQNVPDTALDLYQRALFLYKELNDTKMEANILSNIGIIYYEQGEYIQAMFNTEESLRISSKVNDLHGIAFRCSYWVISIIIWAILMKPKNTICKVFKSYLILVMTSDMQTDWFIWQVPIKL